MITGLWLWQVKPEIDIVDLMWKTRSHVALLKVQDEGNIYNNPSMPTVKALESNGFDVWGWGFSYGRGPQEAIRIIERVEALHLSVFVLDLEGHIEQKPAAGEELVRRVRHGLPSSVKLGASSFGIPSLHTAFPYREITPYLDFWMPQVYWFRRDATQFVNAGVSEHEKFGLPVYPAFSLERPDHTESKLRQVLAWSKMAGMPMISYWAAHLLDDAWIQQIRNS
jgi:hypothetical protein